MLLVNKDFTSKLAKVISDGEEEKSKLQTSLVNWKVLGTVYSFLVRGEIMGTKYLARL